MKSILITGIVIDEKTRDVFNYYNNTYIMYDVLCFTGIELLTLESVDVSIDSLSNIAINPPSYYSDSYRLSVTEYYTPIELVFKNMRSCSKLYSVNCQVLNTRRVVLHELEDYPTINIYGDVFAKLDTVTKSIDIHTKKCSFIKPMLIDSTNQCLVSAFKSAFLTEISTGLYEYGDTTVVTTEYQNSDIILQDSTKKLVIEVSYNISSIVFNKNIDSIDSIGRASIKRIGISKEASHKQLSLITKFIMDCKNIDDVEFDDNFKWELYSRCYDTLRENKKLANEIYNDVEVIVY